MILGAQNPRVTVVIPAYKASETVGRAVESVLTQSGENARVLVVLDGPDEAAENALAAFQSKRVGVLSLKERQGVCAARNAGLASVTEPFVMFLDADDFIEGDLLESGASQMAQEDADIGLSRMKVLDEATNRRSCVSLAGLSPAELFYSWLSSERFVAPSCVLWRTNFVRQIGGWDTSLFRQEDGEIVLRALLMGASHCDLRLGRGVYVQHSRPERLSVRSDNLRSLLDVPAKLLSISSDNIPMDLRQAAAAASYANATRTLMLRGCKELGIEAFARMKSIQASRPRVGRPFSWIYALLPLRPAIAFEQAIRSLLGRPF